MIPIAGSVIPVVMIVSIGVGPEADLSFGTSQRHRSPDPEPPRLLGFRV